MAARELIDVATGRIYRTIDGNEWAYGVDIGDDYEVLSKGERDEGEKQLDKMNDYIAIGVCIAGGSTVMIRTEAEDDDVTFFTGGLITGFGNVSHTSYPCYIIFFEPSTGVATLGDIYRIAHGTGGSSGTTCHILSSARTCISKVVGLIRREA